MPAINITDLNNAKLDVDHLAAIATSTLPTATDRLGNVKQTVSAASNLVAQTAAGQATAARIAAEAARDLSQTYAAAGATAAKYYDTIALGRAGVADTFTFGVNAGGSDGLTRPTLYRRDSASTQTLIVDQFKGSEFDVAVSTSYGRSGYLGGFISTLGKMGVVFRKSDMRPIFGNGGDIVSRIEATETISTRVYLAAATRIGLTHAWITPAGRMPLYVNKNGRLIALGRDFIAELDAQTANIAANTANSNAAVAALNPSINMTLHGDSQINGAGPTPWRTAIIALISARTINNLATGGWTSTQIASRFATVFPLVTLSGNEIVATTAAVSVTAVNVYTTSEVLAAFLPLTSQGPQSALVSIAGVAGTFTRVSEGVFTFARSMAGTAVNVQPNAPLRFTRTAGFDANLYVIGVGRNNNTDTATIRRDTLSLSQSQSTIRKRQIILTWTNGGSITPGAATNEGVGTAVGDACIANELWAENTFVDPGIVVLNIRKYSFQFSSGSADDIADIAAGTVPRSLRIDAVHYTAAFHLKIAELIAFTINSKGW